MNDLPHAPSAGTAVPRNGENAATVPCFICRNPFPAEELATADMVRPRLARLIARDHRGWTQSSGICLADLNRYRIEYVRHVLEAETGELSVLETDVIQSLKDHELLSSSVQKDFEARRTFPEKVSDALAAFGGSWFFILAFGVFMAGWIAFNTFLAPHSPDPYPFILLNLMLSCLAALQAPVIMMSQNRQEARDRLRAEGDYKINLKAELEIRHLHEKMDHLLRKQSQRLFEIQQIQLDLMRDLGAMRNNAPRNGNGS